MKEPVRHFLFELVGAALSIVSYCVFAQNNASRNIEESIFEQNCALCRNNPATRAPTRSSLHAMLPAFIVEALTNGIVKTQGAALSPEQRVALAEFLTGRKIGAEAPMAGRCISSPGPLSIDGPTFNGWGANIENWRFQPEPGISAAQLDRLEPKWAFGIPGVVAMP
jgi:polyvinyl alcohol dehydrogenase (cytochrome)